MTDDSEFPVGFVTGDMLLDAVRSTIVGARVDIAVAYWGPSALELLDMPRDARHVRVACDAFSGFCSPVTLAGLLERGAKVFDVPGLHAKIYLGAGALVVGSANASANGFGQHIADGGLDLEAAYVAREAGAMAHAGRWLHRVFNEGKPVTPRDIPEIRAMAKQVTGRPKRAARSFRQTLLEDPEWFLGRRLRVYMYDADEPDASVQQEYRDAAFAMSEEGIDAIRWPYYWGTEEWEVEEGDLVLDFIREGRKIRCTGVWRVQGRTASGRVTGVELVEGDPCGASFPVKDWKALAKDVVDADAFASGRHSELLDVVDFGRGLYKGACSKNS